MIGIVLAVLLVGAILAWPMVRRIVVGPCACTQSPSPTGTPIALVLAWRS